MALNVLYEDNHIIVVVKPVNAPVQADETGDFDLLSEVKAYIKEKYEKPGEVYCGLVHRLDRPVGGVMVFARTSKAASRLAPQFAEKGGAGAKKRYAAVVCGRAAPRGTLKGFIVKDEATHTSHIVPEGTAGAKSASLDYTQVCNKNGLALLDVDLHTGRHHQIRAQLASVGLPIWGDQRYNPTAKAGQQIALWAYSLDIEHPVKRERMRFTCPPPADVGIWGRFNDELSGLCAGLNVVFCDSNIIIINKPAGLTVADADGGDDTCESRLRTAFGEVYPVHRLDAVTSGLVVFARNKAAKTELDNAIRERSIKKSYQMITCGSPVKTEGRLTLYGVKDPAAAFVKVYDKKPSGVASFDMVTDYRVMKRMEGFVQIRSELVTGRTHQLRASFAHIGCPILGDDKYGDRELNRTEKARLLYKKGELCLCACEVEFGFDSASPLAYLNGKRVSIAPPFWL